ncbi:MAG: pilin [Patescibacteria group bacterium]|jgi:hypothetical protein
MNKKLSILGFTLLIVYFLLLPLAMVRANYVDDCLKQQQDQLDDCESNDAVCRQQAADDFSLCKSDYETTQNAQLASSDATANRKYGDLILNIPIGSFTGGNVNENLLGNYIKAWYDLMLGVISIVATVMIMWAGFKWLLARGDSGKITDAKSMIFSALAGLALALLSYTLMSIINPGLTIIDLGGLKPIEAPMIEQYNDPRLDTSPYNINQNGERSTTEKKLDQIVWEEVLALDPNKTEDKLFLDFIVPPTEYLPGGSFTEEVMFTQNPAGGYIAKWEGMSEQDKGIFLNIILNNISTDETGLNWDVKNIYDDNRKLEGILLVPRAYIR